MVHATSAVFALLAFFLNVVFLVSAVWAIVKVSVAFATHDAEICFAVQTFFFILCAVFVL